MTPKRFVWTAENVASRDFARTMVRTYIEQEQLSDDVLKPLSLVMFDSVAEVGAGFGRMTLELAQHAMTTTAFEREPDMIATMQKLLPNVNAVQVNALTNLPADSAAFDLVLSFTVLQHMTDATARGVLGEMARISRRYVLVVEDTDPEHHYVDKKDPSHFTHGRTPAWYGRYLPGFELKQTWPREVEPGFTYKGVPRPTVGEYMLFERAS